jgi:hypothetical protein
MASGVFIQIIGPYLEALDYYCKFLDQDDDIKIVVIH